MSYEGGSHFVWWLIFPAGEAAGVGGGSASLACLHCRCGGWSAGGRAEVDCEVGKKRRGEDECECHMIQRQLTLISDSVKQAQKQCLFCIVFQYCMITDRRTGD